MKIVIIGGGFTGLTAALRLLQKGHKVVLIERESSLGGLAGGFKKKPWLWTLEKSYHHWFTNDDEALGLAKELGQEILIKRPKTSVLVGGNISSFDSPVSVLTFPYLPLIDRIRLGMAVLFLKIVQDPSIFKKAKALSWIRRWMGKKATELIWEPLFIGKFNEFKDDVALTWFWARIKKRTSSLAYPAGGFKTFAEEIAAEINKLGGEVLLETEVLKVRSNKSCFIQTSKGTLKADQVIFTTPTSVFTRVVSGLPARYTKRVSSVPHLCALNLILVLNKPFMGDNYWLNITDKSYPFLVLAEHTNFMHTRDYGNQHIVYIGNYLPANHPFLKMSAGDLLKVFDPYLKEINGKYRKSIVEYQKFVLASAQPVMGTNYTQLIPKHKTPIKNVYIANLDMVYPWDRGTNYAIKMGEDIANLIQNNFKT